MESPMEILMKWIISESSERNLDVADVYFKAKELLNYEKEYLKGLPIKATT